MPDGMSKELKDAFAAGDEYEAKKAEQAAAKAAKDENIAALDAVREQLVIQRNEADDEAEAELAPLRAKRDEAQAKADAKHKP